MSKLDNPKPDWRIEISRSNPRMSKVYYKNQPVSSVSALNVDVNATSPSEVKFSIPISNVNIQSTK